MATTHSHHSADLSARASMLVRQIIGDHDPRQSKTCSMFDAAWVSMVNKTMKGKTRWLFPSSFEYLLDHQQHDGGWQNTASHDDGIVNSMAALLAICKHISEPYQHVANIDDLQHRKLRAIYFLEIEISRRTIDFDMMDDRRRSLVGDLLHMLRHEGLEFSFHGRDRFRNGRESGNIDPSYGASSTEVETAATSFVERQKLQGLTMDSPASTAAHLMHCTIWDEEAELNLAHSVAFSNSQSSGGEPAKPPIKANDIAITISTLLENGFTHKDLGAKALGCTATSLEDQLRLGNGVIELAANRKPDTDTIAKAISALCLLGQSPSPEGLVVDYDSREYVKTHDHNRNLSFDTNCHVLKAFLGLFSSNSQHMCQVERAVRLICDSWWRTNGPVSYQSHKSEFYSIMLMVEAFTRLVELWQNGRIHLLDDPSICGKVIISLYQALIRILRSQDIDGSWDTGHGEVTSYAVISLTKLTFLSFSPKIRMQVSRAIESGQRYLMSGTQASSEPGSSGRRDFTPGSGVMRQAYQLAALKATPQKQQTETSTESCINVPLAKIIIQSKYFSRQAWFANVPEWLIQACLVETHLFLPQIKEVRYAILPRNCVKDDRYYESVPFAFIVANALDDRNVGAGIIQQMSLLTIINRQLEGYLERVMGDTLAGCALEVERIVYDKFKEFAYDDGGHGLSDSRDASYPTSSKVRAISDVRSILHRFISHLLDHPYVVKASPHDKAQLRSELLSFLIGRIRQLSGGQDDSRSTDQTPHLYAFSFLACLAGKPNSSSDGGPNGDFLDSPEQQYLAADLCRHISIISFISNTADEHQAALIEPTTMPNQIRVVTQHAPRSPSTLSLTSTSSSSYEDSESPVSPLSSVSSSSASSPIEGVFTRPPPYPRFSSVETLSQETLQMARLLSHERRCLNMCFEGLLEAGIPEAAANIIKFFVDFNDLAEQIFRDPNVGSSCQPEAALEDKEEACIISPPVPPKRARGSVAAARAAMTIETNAAQHISSTQQQTESDRQTFSVANSLPPPFPALQTRDWSWNQTPVKASRRLSKPSSEISRIESIMSEIDGVKLQFESKPVTKTQRRTASESRANHIPLQSHTKNAHRRLTSLPTQDAESIKLAKARSETQRRIRQETEWRNAKAAQENAKAETAVLGRLANRPQKQEWIKVPPAECLESMEVRAKKLSRASRLGGPKWKAPF